MGVQPSCPAAYISTWSVGNTQAFTRHAEIGGCARDVGLRAAAFFTTGLAPVFFRKDGVGRKAGSDRPDEFNGEAFVTARAALLPIGTTRRRATGETDIVICNPR